MRNNLSALAILCLGLSLSSPATAAPWVEIRRFEAYPDIPTEIQFSVTQIDKASISTIMLNEPVRRGWIRRLTIMKNGLVQEFYSDIFINCRAKLEMIGTTVMKRNGEFVNKRKRPTFGESTWHNKIPDEEFVALCGN